jgi:hypothetical protein
MDYKAELEKANVYIMTLHGIIKQLEADLEKKNTVAAIPREVYVEGFLSGISTPGFELIVRDCPVEIFRTMTIDLSRYVSNGSEIFDIAMSGGYNPIYLRDLENAISAIFNFNYCFPHMPNWKRIIRRISHLTTYKATRGPHWEYSLKLFNAECERMYEYIRRSPDATDWASDAETLRKNLTRAIKVSN